MNQTIHRRISLGSKNYWDFVVLKNNLEIIFLQYQKLLFVFTFWEDRGQLTELEN